MKECIKTKFGNANIYKAGYYIITSRKEGNRGKYLHRLVWEDWYNKSVPDGYDIHHLNGDKTDNRIQNLQCVEHRLHMRFHNEGKKPSDETKKKISETLKGKTFSEERRKNISISMNTTGYLNVSKEYRSDCKQGFMWRYQYYKNGKQKTIRRVNLNDLEEEVKRQGFEWKEL